MQNTPLTVDKTSATPIADQIYNEFLTLILNGRFAPGERLPTERELSESLGVSRGTVKRAYSRLEQANAIEIRKGSGSYVRTDGGVLDIGKKEAAAQISSALDRMYALGLSAREISSLVNHCLANRSASHRAAVLLVSDDPTLHLDLERRLAELSDAPAAFSITNTTSAQIFRGLEAPEQYDLIIAATAASAELPDAIAAEKIIDVGIAPSAVTLVALSELPAGARVMIVRHRDTLTSLAMQTLSTLGFSPDDIDLCDKSDCLCKLEANSSCAAIHFGDDELSGEFTRRGIRHVDFRCCLDRAAPARIAERLNGLR